MNGGEDRRGNGVKKELKYIVYIYQFPIRNINIMLLIKINELILRTRKHFSMNECFFPASAVSILMFFCVNSGAHPTFLADCGQSMISLCDLFTRAIPGFGLPLCARLMTSLCLPVWSESL